MTRAGAWAARAAALAAGLWLASAALAGCGAAPTKLGPTGIDELTIPTPTPDPADFGGDDVNPWFPLEPGTVWTYRQDSVTSRQSVTAEVLTRTRDIAGITTTAVRWEVRGRGGEHTLVTRWYAVDRAGDVWWFGQRVVRGGPTLVDLLAPRSFLAGRGGAEAGLVLPARPRLGDGYYNAEQPHVIERRSTVISLKGTVATMARTYHDAVVTRDLSGLVPLRAVQTFFVRGIGIVAQQDTVSASSSLTLLDVRRP
jgi:hypothetical protein